MKFCGYCGTKTEDDAMFCAACGSKLHSEAKSVSGNINSSSSSEGKYDIFKDITQDVSSLMGHVKNKLADINVNVNGHSSATAKTDNSMLILHLIMVWGIPSLCLISLAVMAFKCVTGQNFLFELGEYIYEESPILRFVDWFFAALYVGVGFLVFKARMDCAAFRKKSDQKLMISIALIGFVNLLYVFYFTILSNEAYGLELLNENTSQNMVVGLFSALVMFAVTIVNSKINKSLYE